MGLRYDTKKIENVARHDIPKVLTNLKNIEARASIIKIPDSYIHAGEVRGIYGKITGMKGKANNITSNIIKTARKLENTEKINENILNNATSLLNENNFSYYTRKYNEFLKAANETTKQMYKYIEETKGIDAAIELYIRNQNNLASIYSNIRKNKVNELSEEDIINRKNFDNFIKNIDKSKHEKLQIFECDTYEKRLAMYLESQSYYDSLAYDDFYEKTWKEYQEWRKNRYDGDSRQRIYDELEKNKGIEGAFQYYLRDQVRNNEGWKILSADVTGVGMSAGEGFIGSVERLFDGVVSIISSAAILTQQMRFWLTDEQRNYNMLSITKKTNDIINFDWKKGFQNNLIESNILLYAEDSFNRRRSNIFRRV